MATPKKKRTIRRQRNRVAMMKLDDVNLSECPNCHKLIPSHTVCKHCGYYNDEKIIVIKEKKTKEKKA
jgi:large subunit ribosomal protein L32